MDKNKHIQIEVFNHRNIYADIFIPIMRRPGYNSGIKTTHSIILSKQIGVSLSEKEELDKIKLMIKKLDSHKIKYQITSNKLKFNPSNLTIQLIKESFKDYKLNNNLIEAAINSLFNSKEVFKFNLNTDREVLIKDALINTLRSFEASEDNVNASKMVNISVKLVNWVNSYLKEILSEKTNLIDKASINAKVIHFGDLSHQDSYYLLLAYYLGLDVAYFNFESFDLSGLSRDFVNLGNTNTYDKFSKNESLEAIEAGLKEGSKAANNNIKAPSLNRPRTSPSQAKLATDNNRPRENPTLSSTVNPPSKQKPTPNKIDLSRNRMSNSLEPSSRAVKKDLKSTIVINPKKFNGDIKSILEELKDRAGFVGQPSPVHPVYFIRYIGVYNDKNLYRNEIYNLDKKLNTEYRNYIRFESPIQIGNYTDINRATSSIWTEFTNLTLDNLDELIKYLNGSNVFSFLTDDEVKNRCILAIKEVLKIAFHGASSIATSKVKNLVIKLIGWLRDNDKVFRGYSYDKNHNPKVIFYGDIKSHEALFLMFLYYSGVDILFINSFQDDVFEELDPNSDISTVYALDKVHPQEDFPTSEVMVLKHTSAYQASEEINKIVHNDQDGVYKPWQFEAYKTMPLTLKTTYDEVFILWDEHARIRTGFKVENRTIYIPNMFVKISATHEDINEYWKIVRQATSSKLTQFYSNLPFTNIDFSSRELYSIDTAFENHSMLSFDKLKNHKLYKYSHLSNELQSLIFDKICMLLDMDIILKNNDEDLRLKIVMTVLNLNSELLKLIQNFDFPANIPKLVIYDGDETTFSLSDSITMAFLYTLGFDICVLTPTGYNNFEMFIDDKYYSVFKLPNKQFNLDLPDLKRNSGARGKGFWASIFG